MTGMMIKYTVLIFSAFHIYHKSQGLLMGKMRYFLCALISVGISLAVCVVRQNIVSASILVMMAAFVLCANLLHEAPLNLLITASACSIAIAYTAFILVAAAISPVMFVVLTRYGDNAISTSLSFSIIGGIQFLIVVGIFRLRRYRAGMPFLKEHGRDNIGAYISVSLILAISFTGAKQEHDLVFVIPIFFILVSGLLLIFWWRSKTTQAYVEQARMRELGELRRELHAQFDVIEDLRNQNSELSKIIHRDNKLIPAMECALRDYMTAQEHGDMACGQALLEEFSRMTQDRRQALHRYASKTKKLPDTGLVSIDVLLEYMRKRAQSHQIDFEVSFTDSLKLLVETCIAETDLQTLLADFMENALIATKTAESRHVLLHIGAIDGHNTIRVFDSGVPFGVDTLVNLGLERTTTHQGEGGSGIGMMSAFAIMHTYQASLVIDECLDTVLYSKCVAVCFDGLSEYRLKARNPAQVAPLIHRPDLTLVFEPQA